MMVIGVILLVLAVGLLLVGALAVGKKLPGNQAVGLRVPEVRKSREAWDAAHSVAGPFWIIAGVALLFGGLISFIASGWFWVLPVVTVVVAVVAVSVGANAGARMAVLFDKQVAETSGGCGENCNCGSGGHSETPAPEVDVDALRRAANAADQG